MSTKTISIHNPKIYIITEFLRSLYFTVPIFIFYLTGFLSPTQISIFMGYSFLIQLLLELPTGAFADIFGKKISVSLAYLLDAIYITSFAFAQSFPQFLIIASIGGIAEALRSGAMEALVYDSLKQDGKENDFSKVIAKQGTTFQFGLIFATIVGGFIYQINSRLPFLLIGLTHLLATIISSRFIEPKIDTEKFSLKNYFKQIKIGAKEAFKSQYASLMSLYYIAVGSISWMAMIFYADYLLIDLGFDSQTRGIISGSLRLLNILIIYKFLTNEKIMTKTRTLIFFPVIMITAFLPGIWLQSWWGIPFIGMAMMSSTTRWILLGKYTNQVFDSKYRATAISTLSMAISIIYVVFTFTTGPIMERFGGSRTIFTIFGAISLLTIPPLAYKLIKLEKSTPKLQDLLPGETWK